MTLTDKKIWSKESRLEKNDFLGIKGNNSHDAHSTVGIEYSCSIDWADENHDAFRFTEIKTFAFFIPKESHYPQRILVGPEDLLKHEQGHFDLCEEFARHLKEEIEREVSGKIYPVTGRDDDDRQDYGNELASKIIRKIYDVIKTRELEEQKKYDDDTKHGTIPAKQKKWNSRFSKLRE